MPPPPSAYLFVVGQIGGTVDGWIMDLAGLRERQAGADGLQRRLRGRQHVRRAAREPIGGPQAPRRVSDLCGTGVLVMLVPRACSVVEVHIPRRVSDLCGCM